MKAQRSGESFENEYPGRRRPGGPPDDATGVEVEHDGEIESQPLPVQTCMILAVPV